MFEEEARKQDGIEFLAQAPSIPTFWRAAPSRRTTTWAACPKICSSSWSSPSNSSIKTKVRVVGKALGLPDGMVYRQPFPGPGLGVRCLGAITRERLECVRASDAILREEFAKNGLEGKVWQYFTVVPDFKSVGVKDGKRTFAYPVIIRAVNTKDAMTATVEDVPFAPARAHHRPHHQRGARRQPRAVRPHPQALRHHRVGITGKEGRPGAKIGIVRGRTPPPQKIPLQNFRKGISFCRRMCYTESMAFFTFCRNGIF